MKGPVQIPQTPITEETFKKQGWTKEFEDDEKGDEYYFNTKLDFIKDPINLNFLNYKSDDNSTVSLKLDGKFKKNKT